MIKRLGLVILLSLCSTAIYAEDATSTAVPAARDTYYTSGYILGLNLGQATIEAQDVPTYNANGQGFAARPYIGYQFSPYASAEIGYVFLPTLKYTSDTGGAAFRVSTNAFDLLIGGKFPLGEGFAVYGKVGAAMLKSTQSISGAGSTNQNATVFAYAGGIDYAFANIGGLHMILDYYHTDDKNTNTFQIPALHMYSAGIYYLF